MDGSAAQLPIKHAVSNEPLHGIFFAAKRSRTASYISRKTKPAPSNGGTTMTILAFLRNHAHYWGIPHSRSRDNRLIQTCYECGAEREVKIELRSYPVEDVLTPIHGDHLAA